MPKLRHFFMFAWIALSLAEPSLRAQPANLAESNLLTERRPAAFAAAIQQALQNEQADEAYLHARAWKRAAPGEGAPLTALAGAYLAFDAPAAALHTLKEALALNPPLEEHRRILALKIQTHAEMGDYPAAWSNARDYLRSSPPDDPFASVIAQIQWSSFGPVVAAEPYSAVMDRVAHSSDPVPLTAAYIQSRGDGLTAELDDVCNRAYQTNNDETISQATSKFTRYLLVAHYVPALDRPGTFLAPILAHPNAHYILNDLASGNNPSGLALSLLQWAPQTTGGRMDFAGDMAEETGTEDHIARVRQDARQFLASVPAIWSDLQTELAQRVEAADKAKTPAEIEIALRDLILLQNTKLGEAARRSINYRDQLHAWLETQSASATAADRKMAGDLTKWTATFETSPPVTALQRRLDPALPDASPDEATSAVSLPRRLAQLLLREADAEWITPLQILEKNPSPRLEDFDVLIARNLMTPALWDRRLAVARQLDDWSEIVWSGVEARANDPAAIADWLAPFVAENDQLITRAMQSMKTGDEEQTAMGMIELENALRRDPGHISGLQTLYQSYLARGDDPTATNILESLWRLDPADFTVSDDTLALAARDARWHLLLSLSDYRLSHSDTDATAYLHRQIASVALGYGGLATDSTAALDGTVYANHARVLHSMASELKAQSYDSFVHPITGLQTTAKLLGIENDDPVFRLWLALGLKFSNSVFGTGGVKWETLAAQVSSEMKTHLDFIRAAKPDAEAYLAAFQGTPGESTALFVHHFIEVQLRPTPAKREALAALSHRPDLPLLFRAKAAAANGMTVYKPGIPIRVSDPFYVAADMKNWDAVWPLLAPGQLVIALGEVQLPKDPAALPILRLSRPPRHPLIPLSNLSNYRSRLWELDGVQITDRSRYLKPWQIDAGSVAAIIHSSVQGRVFDGDGSLWIEESDLSSSNGRLGQLFQADVKSAWTAFTLTRRWEAHLLRAEENTFTLGAATATTPATRAIISHSLFVNHQAEPFKIGRADQVRIATSRFFTQKPLGLSPGQVIFDDSRVTGAAQPELASAQGIQLTTLNLSGPPDYTASTTADLRQALGKAKPGQRIDVAPGRLLLDDGPLLVSQGIVLRGSTDPKNPTILSVSPGSLTSPLIITPKGDSWLEYLTLDVEKATITHNGRQVRVADRLSTRKAIVAKNASRPLLRNIAFAAWYASDRERQALVAENAQISINGVAPPSVLLVSGGRIDHIGLLTSNPLSISGTGEAYFSHAGPGAYEVSGKNLRFHGSPSAPGRIIYRDGAGDSRTLAWRANARQNLLDTLAQLKAQLPARLNAAPDFEARMEIFRATAVRLGPLVRASQMGNLEVAGAFAASLNGALTSRIDEFPFYLEAFHFKGRAFDGSPFLYSAHYNTFAPANRDQLKAHVNALVGSRQRTGGDLTSTDRANLMTMMRNYPVGSPNHARAIAAFNQGKSPGAFQEEIRLEAEARRRALEYAAQLKRQQAIAWEQQRLAAQTPPAPAKKSWWENYQAEYPSGRYNSRGSTGGSANQQMGNYVRELNKRIYNAGRDYGDERVY